MAVTVYIWQLLAGEGYLRARRNPCHLEQRFSARTLWWAAGTDADWSPTGISYLVKQRSFFFSG